MPIEMTHARMNLKRATRLASTSERESRRAHQSARRLSTARNVINKRLYDSDNPEYPEGLPVRSNVKLHEPGVLAILRGLLNTL